MAIASTGRLQHEAAEAIREREGDEKDTLGQFFAWARAGHDEDVRRVKDARRLAQHIAQRLPEQLDAAAQRMAARLQIFDLRFLPTRRVPRWHYPDRMTTRDLDASSFIIDLFHDGDREIIGSAMFAVLAPDLENREFGRATLLARTVMGSLEEQPRHYADLRDSSGLRLIVEKELVTCAAPELRARMGG